MTSSAIAAGILAAGGTQCSLQLAHQAAPLAAGAHVVLLLKNAGMLPVGCAGDRERQEKEPEPKSLPSFVVYQSGMGVTSIKLHSTVFAELLCACLSTLG